MYIKYSHIELNYSTLVHQNQWDIPLYIYIYISVCVCVYIHEYIYIYVFVYIHYVPLRLINNMRPVFSECPISHKFSFEIRSEHC